MEFRTPETGGAGRFDRTVNISGGVTINEQFTLSGVNRRGHAFVNFVGPQTVDGVGSFVFDGSEGQTFASENAIVFDDADNQAAEGLVIGEDLEFSGIGGFFVANPGQDSLLVQGEITLSSTDELMIGAGVEVVAPLIEIGLSGSILGQFGRITGSGSLELPETLRLVQENAFAPAIASLLIFIDLGEINGSLTNVEDQTFDDLVFDLVVDLDDDLLALLVAGR